MTVTAAGVFCAACGRTGNRRLLLQIIAAGFPPDFQVLCYNCNCGRARNGGLCPHKEPG